MQNDVRPACTIPCNSTYRRLMDRTSSQTPGASYEQIKGCHPHECDSPTGEISPIHLTIHKKLCLDSVGGDTVISKDIIKGHLIMEAKKPKPSRRGKLRHANFLLEFSDYVELQLLAAQTDRTVGYCIRVAIREYLARHTATDAAPENRPKRLRQIPLPEVTPNMIAGSALDNGCILQRIQSSARLD